VALDVQQRSWYYVIEIGEAKHYIRLAERPDIIEGSTIEQHLHNT
jgi:hypothetical protein